MSDIVKHVDRNIPTLQRAQVFTQADAGVADVIQVKASLGRSARQVRITATDPLTIKFNTQQMVFPRRESSGGMFLDHLPNVTMGQEYIADTTSIALLALEEFVFDGNVADITIVSAAGNFEILVM